MDRQSLVTIFREILGLAWDELYIGPILKINEVFISYISSFSRFVQDFLVLYQKVQVFFKFNKFFFLKFFKCFNTNKNPNF